MSGHSVESLEALLLGFALAGVLASGFEALSRRPLGLAALRTGDLRAFACVPLLVFSAPLLILRAILAAGRKDAGHVPFVMLATVLAGGWSLMSGRLVFDLARLLARG